MDSDRIYLFKYDSIYFPIFSNGIVFPQMIYCQSDSPCTSLGKPIFKNNVTKTDIGEEYIGWNGGVTFIDRMKEIKFFRLGPHVRRFELWLNTDSRLYNGYEIEFLEIVNEKANKKTSLEEFCKGAHATFFKRAWTEI